MRSKARLRTGHDRTVPRRPHRAPEARRRTRCLPLRLLPPPPEGTILAPPEPPDPARRGWFFAELWAEMRLAAQMYFDPRYRVSRTAQIAFPLFAVLLVFNYFLFSVWFSVTVVSPVAERLLDVILVGARVPRTRPRTRPLPRRARLPGQVRQPAVTRPRAPQSRQAMIRLGVNIDHVATVRQARRAKEPDPVAAAVLAMLGGADGITIHLREDRRHIQDRDVLPPARNRHHAAQPGDGRVRRDHRHRARR